MNTLAHLRALRGALREAFGRDFRRRHEQLVACFDDGRRVEAEIDPLEPLPFGMKVEDAGELRLELRAHSAEALIGEARARAELLQLRIFECSLCGDDHGSDR
jgi:hypothetical protein